jgi:hypothetical protein
MTLEYYVKCLNILLEKHPEYAEFPVIYSTDDEGNHYQPVYFIPGVITVDNPESNYPEPVNSEILKPNAICIN